MNTGYSRISFEARTIREAHNVTKETWLHADLASLKSGGVPLYSTLSVGPATAEEAIVFGHAADVAKPSDDMLLAYLIDLDDVDV